MPESDLDLLIETARRAGEIALPYWRNAPEEWDKGAGAGPVTEADIAVNDMLRETLLSARPDYGWLSEESDDDRSRLGHERAFIVDPIDGTRAFIAGEKSWSHSIAVAHGGEIMAGVIFLPVLQKLYSAQKGHGAQLNDRVIRASGRKSLENASLLSAKSNLAQHCWNGGAPPVQRVFRPSLAYRMALVAEGRFDAMLTLRETWEWDVAAGSLIATEAGATVTDRVGRTPIFNKTIPLIDGLIAASDQVHSAIRDRLA